MTASIGTDSELAKTGLRLAARDLHGAEWRCGLRCSGLQRGESAAKTHDLPRALGSRADG